MRKVEQRRNIAVLVTVAAAGVFVTFAMLRIGPEHEVLFGLGVAAGLTTLIGLCFALVYHAATRQRQRLLRGERLLARWTLSEDVWSQFCAQQHARADGTKNLIDVRERRSAQGVPVVMTEESLMVDDDFFHLGELRELTWHETAPAYFDFRSVTYTKSSAIPWHLRVPASDSDPVAMRKIWDYFQGRLAPLAPGSRIPRIRLMRSISLALIPIGAVAAVIAKQFYHEPSMQSIVVVALVVATLTLSLGVIMGAMTHWWLTSGQGNGQS